MKDFLKKYKWLLSGLFVVPLLVSYFWFVIDGFIPVGDIGKSNWLSFWGGYLAFYGAIFLGLVAVWQNEQAGIVNKRLLDIEECSRNTRQSCNVILYKQHIQIQGQNSSPIPLSNEHTAFEASAKRLFFGIKNHGEAVLKRIEIIFPRDQVFLSHIVLAKGEAKNVKIKMPKDLKNDEEIIVHFISCNEVRTYGDFQIMGTHEAPTIRYYHFYGLKE